MFKFYLLALSTHLRPLLGQSGVDLDEPMLRGGRPTGPQAMLRFGCSQVVIERLDPLVNPGLIPSTHNHQVAGGNAFSASMPYDDISKHASCTTCHFIQDLSNYWTANLYFKARNGTYKRVPQMANQFNQGDNAGKLYITLHLGFRMLTGEAMRRTSENLGKNMQQCYRCFTEPNFGGSPYSPCMDPQYDTDYFPQQPCAGGIRSNIIFPLCWDGNNLDSPNHRDHVSHPVDGATPFSIANGTCPDHHPVKIPQVMLEVMWNTTTFNTKVDWPVDGSQPFVLSTGDTTGFGQHGDYVFGWQDNSLQRAMDHQCYLRNCTQLTEQVPKVKNLCQVPVTVNEDVDGWMNELPGGHTGA